MADESIISYGDLIKKDDTFKDLEKEIKRLKASLKSLAKDFEKGIALVNPNDSAAINKYDKELQELTQTKKTLEKLEETAAKAKKKNIELTNEELIQAAKEKAAARERQQIAKQDAIIQTSKKNSIEALRAELSKVTIQWKKLTSEEIQSTKTGRDLAATKKRLTAELLKQEKATGDARRQVGFYERALGTLEKTAFRIFVGRTIIDGIRKLGSFFGKLIQDNKAADSSLQDLDKSFGAVGKAISNAGVMLLKIFAPALKFVANGIVSIIGFFTGAVDSVKEFTATSEDLKEATKGINEEFAKEQAASDGLFLSLKNTNKGSKERKAIIDEINEQYGKYLPNLLTERSSLQDIEAAQRLVNEQLTKSFLLKIQQATQTDILTNKVYSQRAAFSALSSRLKEAGIAISDKYLPAYSTLLDRLNDGSELGDNLGLSLSAAQFDVKKFTDEIAKTDKGLAELITIIRSADSTVEDVLIEKIKNASNESKAYNRVVKGTTDSITAMAEGLNNFTRDTDSNSKSLKDNTTALQDNSSARLKAIKNLQDEIAKLEIEDTEDQLERLLALEDLRLKEERKLAIDAANEKLKALDEYKAFELQRIKKGSDAEKELVDKIDKEIAEIEFLNLKLSEQQLKDSEQRKLEIRKDFFVENVKQQDALLTENQKQLDESLKRSNDLIVEDLKKQQESINAAYDYRDRKEKEAKEKQKENTKELLSNISQAVEKVSGIITELFEKQSDLSAKAVDEQSANLERARERAAKGLESNLVFEEQQLEKRKAEQIQRQKEAKQAAEIIALFNLVSAYAQNGDKNALARGLVDFAILKALGAGLDGFFEGTEDTGTTANPLDSKGGRLAVIHNNERILPKHLNALARGMTNEELIQNALLGSQMSDYLPAQSAITQNLFDKQKEDFNKGVKGTSQTDTNSLVIQELRQLNRRLSQQPNVGIEIQKVYENVYDIIKTETKIGMKKVGKKRL